MTVHVYKKSSFDPTADRPPQFYLAKQFDQEPERSQISALMDSASGMAEQVCVCVNGRTTVAQRSHIGRIVAFTTSA
jgi:hypothetical protein